MDGPAFNLLIQRLRHTARRRSVLAGLAGAGLAGAAASTPDGAAAKKKKKKVTICRNGQTLSVVKKKKNAHLLPGDTAGACAATGTTAAVSPGSTTSTTPGPQCPDIRPTADLQAAIDAAVSGSTLRLCPGTFHVTSPLSIEKDLTLEGAGKNLDEGGTVLDGGDKVTVLVVGGSCTVTVQDLTITRGFRSDDNGRLGGGIINNGDLTLRRMAVTFCEAFTGGGIHNFNHTALTLAEGVHIAHNTARDEGGGVSTDGGTMVMKEGSFIENNTAARNGGGIVTFAELTLEAGSFVVDNTATTGEGGGIRHAVGTLTISRHATVEGNTPDDCNSIGGACP
ncbi:MAG: hypothetical protein QM692_05755 [Thermomicrobiales bacterium]